jgi:hypothetical protein
MYIAHFEFYALFGMFYCVVIQRSQFSIFQFLRPSKCVSARRKTGPPALKAKFKQLRIYSKP